MVGTKEESKKFSQSRSWVFTLPALNKDGELIPQSVVEEKLKNYAFVCQLEKGEETGFLHYQGYIENKTPISFDTLRKKFLCKCRGCEGKKKGGVCACGCECVNVKIHIAPRRGTPAQAFDYCTKLETRVEGHYPFGSLERPNDRKLKREEVIASLRHKVIEERLSPGEILLAEPLAASHVYYLEKLDAFARAERASGKIRENLRVNYVYGASGVGKTRSVYEKYDFKDLYVVSDYGHPFDSYTGQKVLVLDEFAGQLSFEAMLKILDIYPCQLPARYNNKWAEFEEVYILSNLPVGALYPSERAIPERWKAFMRRIHFYGERLPGGVVEQREKPNT